QHHAVARRLDRHLHVGAMLVAGDVGHAVRLFGARAPEAARAMIFEAAPDNRGACRQKRRGDAVALKTVDATAVETEGNRPAPVDGPAVPVATPAAHGRSSVTSASVRVTSWVTVSLSIRNTSRHGRCIQISRALPRRLVRK